MTAKADTAPGGGAAPAKPVRLAPVLALCTLVYLLDGLVHSILGPLAPQIAGSLELSHAEMGPIISANLIGQSLGLVLLPLLAGGIGNRGVVIVTAAGFGIFGLATGFAQNGETLFTVRLLTGLFLGGALPTCLAIVTAASPARRRGRTTMTLFTGYGLGATLAGLAVAVFGEDGWRNAMIAVGLCCMLTAIFVWAWLRAPEPAVSAREEGAGNPFAVLKPRYLLGTLTLWVLFVAMLTISYCLNSWLPMLLVEVGHDQSVAAISVTTFSPGGIVAALGVEVLIDRWGATGVLTAFLAISTAMLFVVGQVLATAPADVLLVLLGICGLFVLGAYGGVNVVLVGYYPDALRAIGIGWAKSVGRAGTFIAPILIGFALTSGIGEGTVMSLFALPAALAALAVLVVGMSADRQRRAETQSAAQPAAAE